MNWEERAKQLEDENARLQEDLAQQKALSGELLASLSHEIRTPLNGIFGYCDLVLREEGARLTPHGRGDLNIIKSNVKTLLALINDILDLSKMEAGRVEVVRERIDLVGVVDECVATSRGLLKGSHVTVGSNIAPAVRTIFSDSLKIRHVLSNLLAHAGKSTESGEILVEAVANGSTLVLSIEDTGVGIPADQLAHIFEKLRHVDGSSATHGIGIGGAGLGLAIVRETVRILGGQVEATSTFGRGSKFTLTLPNALDAEASQVTTTTTAPRVVEEKVDSRDDQRLPRVLYIEDSSQNRDIVRRYLHGDFEILEAEDGEHGLERAKRELPDAILMDLSLPRMDGWETTQRIKATPHIAHVPVIVLTAQVSREDRERATKAGCVGYLTKPVERDLLVTTLRQHLGADRGVAKDA